MSNSKVLAITKRPAELCATQTVAYAAGFAFVAATDLRAALSVLRAVPVIGVVICKHSLSTEESNEIAEYLTEHHPETRFARCPGCNSEAATRSPGELTNIVPLYELLAAKRIE